MAASQYDKSKELLHVSTALLCDNQCGFSAGTFFKLAIRSLLLRNPDLLQANLAGLLSQVMPNADLTTVSISNGMTKYFHCAFSKRSAEIA